MRVDVQRAAFSLPELLSACAVTLVILVLSLQALSSSSLICRESAERTAVAGEGRTLMDLMSRDLSAALVPTTGAPTFQLRSASGESGSGEPDQLAFFATFPHGNASGSGDLCLVGYRMEWDTASCSYRVVRFFLDNAALLRLMESTAGNMTPAMIFSASEAIPEVAAEAVWDFTLRPGSGAMEEAAAPERVYSEELPEWVSIRFRTLSSRAAQRLATLPVSREDWRDESCAIYREWILPHSQSFHTRVRLLPQGAQRATSEASE